MSVYPALIIAGFVTLSAGAALAEDGLDNEAIRDEMFKNPRPAIQEQQPVLRQGRASVQGPAPVEHKTRAARHHREPANSGTY